VTTETETFPVPRQPTAMPLVFFPDSKLLEVSQKVTFNPYASSLGPDGIWVAGLKDFADDLVATMQGNKGAGLSAIQVGFAARIIVVEGKETTFGEKDAPIVMVNPQWRISPNGTSQEMMNEGCLSFPAVFEDVVRLSAIEAAWQDVDGVEHAQSFYGVQAQVIQHECEHLDGHLFIEHLPSYIRDRIRLKMKQRGRLTAKIDRLMKRKNGSLQSLISAGLVRGATNRPGFRSGR
jgi:peptide deformylase